MTTHTRLASKFAVSTLSKSIGLLVFGTLSLTITGCQDNTPLNVNQEVNEVEVTALTQETLQVLTDLSPIVQQVLSEAYLNEKNVRIGWLDINRVNEADNSRGADLVGMSITATVADAKLIVPNTLPPMNQANVMTAEEALLNNVPLPEVSGEPTDEATREANPLANSQTVSSQNSHLPNSHSLTGTTLNDADTEHDEEVVVSMKEHYHLPADLDVLLLHSAYDMQNMANHNQLQPIASQLLLERIPKFYQDPNGQWVGLSMYGRSLVYNQQKVKDTELLNYAKLADSKWRQRLCLTDFRYPENQTILQMMTTHRGDKQTQDMLQGWQRNLVGNVTVVEEGWSRQDNDNGSMAHRTSGAFDTTANSNSNSNHNLGEINDGLPPNAMDAQDGLQYESAQTPNLSQQQINDLYFKDDLSLLNAIDTGQCDVGVVNSDSFMHYASQHRDTQVRLTWADQINHGTIVNTITASVAKQSNDTALALDFIEWLSSDKGQALLAFYSKTYPLAPITDPNIDMTAIRPKWSEFKADTSSFEYMFDFTKEPDAKQ